MKLTALLGVCICCVAPALAVSQATAQATGQAAVLRSPPPGRYTMRLAAGDSVPGFYYGAWTLVIRPDQSYRIALESDTVVVGKFTAPRPGWIVLTDLAGNGACESEQASGAYDWKVTGDQLTLHPSDEPCDQRGRALSAKVWHRSH